jgi:hypothetical protein
VTKKQSIPGKVLGFSERMSADIQDDPEVTLSKRKAFFMAF